MSRANTRQHSQPAASEAAERDIQRAMWLADDDFMPQNLASDLIQDCGEEVFENGRLSGFYTQWR